MLVINKDTINANGGWKQFRVRCITETDKTFELDCSSDFTIIELTLKIVAKFITENIQDFILNLKNINTLNLADKRKLQDLVVKNRNVNTVLIDGCLYWQKLNTVKVKPLESHKKRKRPDSDDDITKLELDSPAKRLKSEGSSDSDTSSNSSNHLGPLSFKSSVDNKMVYTSPFEEVALPWSLERVSEQPIFIEELPESHVEYISPPQENQQLLSTHLSLTKELRKFGVNYSELKTLYSSTEFFSKPARARSLEEDNESLKKLNACFETMLSHKKSTFTCKKPDLF